MARKQIEGQSQLFEVPVAGQEYSSGSVTNWQDLESRPARFLSSRPSGSDGVAVSVESRAYHLSRALVALGKSSQREHGLGVAVDIEPHSSKIWGRYKGGTQIVVERALGNAEFLKNDAKRDFWQATGLPAMIGAGMISERGGRARARQMWNDFYGKYSGPPNRKARDAQRRNQRRVLRG